MGRVPYRELRRQARRRLDPRLNLNLNLDLSPPLFLGLFAGFFRKSFQKLFVASFGSWFEGSSFGFCLLPFDFFYEPLPPPRQSVGRPLPGRIVVRDRRTTT